MPFKDREAYNAYRRQARQVNRRNRSEEYAKEKGGRAKHAPFVGCDGEGFTNAQGRHVYNMFRIGDNLLKPRAGEERLRTKDILEFICSQDPQANYVGFVFNYDVTMMMMDLPRERALRLCDRKSRVSKSNGRTFPVDWDEYRFDWMPNKFFEVQKRIPGEKIDNGYGELVDKYGPKITIQDVGSFFQTSFVSALTKWEIGDQETRDRIQATKVIRGEFTPEMFDKVAEYNREECVLLAKLMECFRDVVTDLGITPKSWTGPGQLVEALLAKEGFPKSKDVPLLQDASNAEVLRFAQNAYYGGRNEVSRVGHWDSAVYQYDINSAYPAAMLKAPCLVHGRFIESRPLDVLKDMQEHEYALVYGTFFPHPDNHKTLFYGLPFRRKNGSIFFPGSGKGWYWNFEINSAIHQKFKPEKVFYYVSHCDCKPFGFVLDLYQLRLKLGKTSKGLALKLILNSIYGKMAQSVGLPQYSNPIYASFFTAQCRTQVANFQHSNPACRRKKGYCGMDLLMIATDAVYSTVQRKDVLPKVHKQLGGWDEEIHDSVLVVQAGLYFMSETVAKTRGIPKAVYESGVRGLFEQALVRFMDTWDPNQAVVEVPTTTFFGLRVTAQRRDWRLLGQWHDEMRKLTFSWASKRGAQIVPSFKGLHWNFLQDEEKTYEGVFFLTLPEPGDSSETVPYNKNIGGQLFEAIETLEDQPDWGPHQFQLIEGM